MKHFILSALIVFSITTASIFIFTNSTLTGLTHTVDNVTYKCAKSDDTLWLCFESFKTWLGFNDLRLAFEYNPQTKIIGKVTPNSTYYQSIRM